MTFLRFGLFVLAALVTATGAHAQIAFRAAAQAGQAAGGTSPIAYVGAGAVATNNTTGCNNTVSPAMPAGLAGDVLVALVNSREDGAAVGATVGWTLAWSATYGGGSELQGYIFYKVATGTNTAADPLTLTQSASCNTISARVARFRGADPVQPLETAPIPGGQAVAQNSNNLDTGTQTTTLDGSMLLVAGFINDDRLVNEGAGWSEAFDNALNLSRDLGYSLHFQLQATAGAAAATNWTFTGGGGSDENFGVIFALRPSALTIAVPAGTTTDDVMIASVTVRDSPTTLIAPAGWTLVREDLQVAGGGATSRLATYSRVVTGPEPIAYSWTFGASAHVGAAGVIATFSGVDTVVPIDAHNGTATAAGADHTAPSVAASAAGAMLVGVFEFGSSTSDWTTGALTEALEARSVAAPSDLGLSMVMAYETLATPGASGTRTATASTAGANADQGVAQLVALRPLLPVLRWSLDENAWSGAAGEVLDLSGNGLHGTSFLGAATAYVTPVVAGSPGTCRYGVFDGVDDYVEVADNPLLDITDELTVMMWLRPTAYAGAGLKTFVSKDGNYEAHLTTTGTVNWWWGGGALELTSAASVPLNQWTHVTLVYSRAGAFQRIYFNGVADANTNNQAGALVANGMPLQIASDQGFAGRQFPGLIDEVAVFRSALSQPRIQQYMNATRPCVTLDHYNISHAGSGVACDTHQITITAHDASHAPVDAAARTVTLSTTNLRGTWTGIAAGGGTLSDPTAGDGAATYTFAVGSNSVILDFRYANLAATSETFGFNANDGTYSENTGTAAGTEDPTFTLAQAGFRFNNVTDGNTTIPVQISGKPSNTGWNAKTLRIQAIQTDIATGSCSGLFASQTRSVDLGAECNLPAACAARQVSINGANIATSGDNAGAGAAAYSSVSLNFNASSEADTVIAYPDAGAISLHARFDLDPDVAGFEAVGASNPFVVRPFGLAFPGIAHGNTAAGTVLAAAGDNFALTVQGYQWAGGEDANDDGVPDAGGNITDNGTVPNFAATASVSPSVNLPGVALGLVRRGVGCAGAASVALTGGAGAAADWCYSEAGNVLLLADVADYIVAGVNITGNSGLDGDANGGYVGRFKPKSFAVTGAPTLTNRWNPGCAPASIFTYLGEELTLGFTLEARNAQNMLTQNYTGAYAKLNLGSAASLGLGARDGVTNLTARIDSALAPSGSFTNGVANLVVRTAVARATPDNPDGPFAAAQFGIAPNDADPDAAGGVQMGSFNLDVDGAGGNEHFAVGPTTALRFGRLRLHNAYGSATVALPMALEAQYWGGAQFQRNGDDSCTTLAAAGIGLSGYKLNLGPGETAIVEATIAFASGSGGLTLSPPGAANNGSVLLTPDLAAAGRSYLRGRWGGATWDQDPSATAAFGLYGSQPKNFIFFRENY